MTSNRLQHIVPGLAIFVLASVVTWLSFTEQPAQSFLFPRVISVVFIALATWNLIRAVTGMSKIGRGIPVATVKNLAPGLAVMLLYVFFGAKHLGFYLGSVLRLFRHLQFLRPRFMVQCQRLDKADTCVGRFHGRHLCPFRRGPAGPHTKGNPVLIRARTRSIAPTKTASGRKTT